MNMAVSPIALFAGSAMAAPSESPDPIFAAIDAHRTAYLLQIEMLRRTTDRDEAFKENPLDPRPYALIAWRNYSAIGGSEIERARDTFLAEGFDPAAIEVEYLNARQQYVQALLAKRDWDRRHGHYADNLLRRAFFRAEERAALALTDVRPTSMAGVLALLKHIDDFNSGAFGPCEGWTSEHWHWPETLVDDDQHHSSGRALNMPFAHWIIRNIQNALNALPPSEFRAAA